MWKVGPVVSKSQSEKFFYIIYYYYCHKENNHKMQGSSLLNAAPLFHVYTKAEYKNESKV